MRRPYFAYGSNMDRAQMEARCPGAERLTTARLAGHRFLINRRGVATVVPDAAGTVHGVLWRLDDVHEAELDRYEGVAGGLYRREHVPVATADSPEVEALVYVAADGEAGRPRPDYQERIVAAAEGEGFPAPYMEELRGWLTGRAVARPADP